MRRKRNLKTYPIGLMVFVLVLAIYKAGMLSVSMMVDWRAFLFLIGIDSFYLSLLMLIAVFHGHSRNRTIRQFFWLILVFMTVTYLIDSFVLLALNEHAPLFDMGRYALEPVVVFSFFDTSSYIAMMLLLVSMFITSKFRSSLRKVSYFSLIALVAASVFSIIYAPLPLTRYAMISPQMLWEVIEAERTSDIYSDEQIGFYSRQANVATSIPESRPNIILLVVESLSSINSTKVSGTDGFLDGFDTLAEEGLLFQNFFANHQSSEGGLIALLGGYPPIHFPTATPYMFDEFAIQPSIMAEYRKQGYFAEFLTNAKLDFIGLDNYLNGLGLDRSRGRDEVESMKNAPVIVQDAPSDAFLFAEAHLTIERISKTRSPFLLTIATTSTHLPYRHPEEGPDTAEAVWDWSMQQVNSFYRQLSVNGYFEDGILLITGDHRQMMPLMQVEMTRYGDSARARVPLLLIGHSYARGRLDTRFFQQSDLLRMLGKVKQRDVILSPHPIWVERYNRKYGRIALIDNLSVFDEADAGLHEYRLKTPGNRIEWQSERPTFANKLELEIHSQRSRHQKSRLAMN